MQIDKRLKNYSYKKFHLALSDILKEKNVKLRGLAARTNLNYTYFSKLKNRTKVKIFRRKERYYETNRMLFEMKDIVRLYKIRWKIEETFRVLKSLIGIHRCQQHSIKAQEIFLWMCMVTFSCLERMSLLFGDSIYKSKSNVIFQNVNLDNSILHEVLDMN